MRKRYGMVWYCCAISKEISSSLVLSREGVQGPLSKLVVSCRSNLVNLLHDPQPPTLWWGGSFGSIQIMSFGQFRGLRGWVWNSPLQLTSFPPRCLQAPLSFNERLSRHVFGSLFHNISWLWAKIQFEKDKLANFPYGFAFDWLSPEEAFVEVFSQHYWVLILIFIEWNGSLPNPVVSLPPKIKNKRKKIPLYVYVDWWVAWQS